MAFKIIDCDNVRESFASSGTTISLAGATPESRPFSFKLATGDTTWAVARKGAEISVGIFTYNSGSNSLTQTTVFYSSNGNNAVSFSSGTGEVFIDFPSRFADHLNTIEATVTSAATFDIGAVDALRIAASGTTGSVTSLGTSANKLRIVRWAGATVNHNATSLILIGGANWVTVANDISLFVSDGSGNWRELFRRYADGHLVSYGPLDLSAAAAGQIIFPATQNASANANTLDDYEEGAFTPSVTGLTLAGTATYSTQEGSYTKIGNRVSFELMMAYSGHSGTGTMSITGMPFAAGKDAALSIITSGLTFSGQIAAVIYAGDSRIIPRALSTGASDADVAMDAAASIWVAGSYRV